MIKIPMGKTADGDFVFLPQWPQWKATKEEVQRLRGIEAIFIVKNAVGKSPKDIPEKDRYLLPNLAQKYRDFMLPAVLLVIPKIKEINLGILLEFMFFPSNVVSKPPPIEFYYSKVLGIKEGPCSKENEVFNGLFGLIRGRWCLTIDDFRDKPY